MINYWMNIFLVVLLSLSVYFDIIKRKISNRITMPAILIGIIGSTVSSGLDGFLFSIFGFAFGLAVFLIPYISGGVGAGDVKLMAAIGALMGWKFVLFSSLGTAIVGGVIAVIYMIYKSSLKNTMINALGLILKPLAKWIFKVTGNKKSYKVMQYFEKNKMEMENEYIPYAVAIAIGTFGVLFGSMGGIFNI